mgnify:CR=1 FL=1
MKIFYGTKKLCLRKTKLFLRRMQKRHSSLIICAACGVREPAILLPSLPAECCAACGGIFGRVSALADKLLITKQGDRLITAWTEDGRICRLPAGPLEGGGVLGVPYAFRATQHPDNRIPAPLSPFQAPPWITALSGIFWSAGAGAMRRSLSSGIRSMGRWMLFLIYPPPGLKSPPRSAHGPAHAPRCP